MDEKQQQPRQDDVSAVPEAVAAVQDLSDDRRERLLELFRQADTNESGFLEPREYVAMMKLVKPGMSIDTIRTKFRAIDESNDNKISPDEFLRHFARAFRHDSDERFHARIDMTLKFLRRKGWLGDVFDRFDSNGNGFFTQRELRAVVQYVKPLCFPKYVAALFRAIDTNGDNRVSRFEFVNYYFHVFEEEEDDAFHDRCIETFDGRRRVMLINVFEAFGAEQINNDEFTQLLKLHAQKYVPHDELKRAMDHLKAMKAPDAAAEEDGKSNDDDQQGSAFEVEWVGHLMKMAHAMPNAKFDKCFRRILACATNPKQKRKSLIKAEKLTIAD